MSEVQEPGVSGTAVEVQTAAPVASAPRPTAIQLIEQELVAFIRQREQAVANVHALEGAIQAGQHILAKLRAEAAKAVVEVENVVSQVENKVDTGVDVVKQEVSNVIEFVKKEL